MYIRIVFEDKQQITRKELQSLNDTLSDNVEVEDVYRKQDDRMGTFYSWNETLDPNDKDLIPNEEGVAKKKLVYPTEFFEIGTKKEYMCDMELFFSKHPNLRIKMRGTPKTVDQNYSTLIQQIVGIQEKFENALKTFDQQIEFNQKCDVHIGNAGLLNINEVALLEDSCTDDLQQHLNQGWRIIVANPQSNQRRSDFVLGRYNPNVDVRNTKCVRF